MCLWAIGIGYYARVVYCIGNTGDDKEANFGVVKTLCTDARIVLQAIRVAVTETLDVALIARPPEVAAAIVRSDARSVDARLIADWHAFPVHMFDEMRLLYINQLQTSTVYCNLLDALKATSHHLCRAYEAVRL